MKNEFSDRLILMVDNNERRRKLLQSYLEKDKNFNYSYVDRNTGAEALVVLSEQPVQAIFIAAQLQDMSVLELLLSVQKTHQNIPILVIVENESDAMIPQLLDAGVSFCLSESQLTPLLLKQILSAVLNNQYKSQVNGTQNNNPGQNTEERLQIAFEVAKMGYWEWNIQKDQFRWHGQAGKIFGFQDQQSDVDLTTLLSRIYPSDRDAVTQAIQNSIKNGEDCNVEFRIHDDVQDIHWLNGKARTLFDRDSHPVLMIGVVRDVTERATSDLALSASQRLNQAILDSLPEHIAVLENNGNIVAINKAWQNFAIENNISPSALQNTIGTNYLEVCETAKGECSEESDIVANGIRSVLNGSIDHFRLEYPCHSPTKQHWFLLQATPLIHEDGGVVISHFDITERRKIEAQLATLLSKAQIARESAESANRAKDEFIAQITHDLRSPLSAVLGWTKVLKNKKVNEQVRDEALQTIAESAEKQARLIEDLLDISRMTAGKLRLDVRPVSLSAVIRSAMDIMQPACDAKGIHYTTELATDADDVTGDPDRLEQVIWNLVSNAVKFTPNKGQIKIRLERADPYVCITISDTGCGIKPEHLPFVFERYWQPDSGSGKSKAGLGLGLSLVKYIVELHGGTVYVSSEGQNKGTTFIINLPYRAVRLNNKEEIPELISQNVQKKFDQLPEPPLSSEALSGIFVLVVDDEPSARELVAEILRQHDAEVVTAASAKAAFEIIQSGRIPDLLVSDISMPEEDGYMLISKIRHLSPDMGGSIPAIALTAFGRMEDRVRALSAGFQMHLPKPIEPAELALVAANLTHREIKNLVQF